MVVLIGGGALLDMPTINEQIVAKLDNIRNVQLRKPVILFLPQASSESKPYVNSFYKEFGSRLKCKATCALWRKAEMSREHIADKFAKCDAVYIGGGRYDVLERAFKEMDVLPLLKDCYEQGKLIVGNSAGAMILCKNSISDYKKEIEPNGDYEVVNGSGIVNVNLCPHANEIDRQKYMLKHNLANYVYLKEKEILIQD